MQETLATTTTSGVDRSAAVAACRSFSTSSLIVESFSMKVSVEGT